MSRYLRTTVARETGLPVTTGHGADLGLDTTGEGPWYNLCDEHGEICSHTSLALARAWAAQPTMWCSQCQADARPRVPADWPVQPLGAEEVTWPRHLVGPVATCGHCGRSWDDGASTSMTPTPSGRCPFEPFHGGA